MLYTAILLACLTSAQPSDQGACRTHEMVINGGANPISAYVEAQNQAAQWLAQHPELQQRRLTIRPGRAA